MRALKRAEGDVGKDLRRELRKIANEVRDQARDNAPVGDGRSGSPGRLKRSIRTSIRQSGVSVFSDAEYAYVQDRGGKVGRGHQTLLARGAVSAYMTRAVRSTQPIVTARLQGVLDDLATNFER